ncbi:MAG TPA: hypothetical protein VIB39_03880 [Candidatus Angelobacter sp.]|jgi:hypothetical protein
MSRTPKVPSLLRRIGLSFVLGFGLFVLGAMLQGVLGRKGLTGKSIYVDDLVLGVLAGLVVFAYEQRRYKAMLEKIAMISAMNHHVRNALQAISYAPYTEQAKQIQLIQQSVSRIQWALQEVLPGAVDMDPKPVAVESSAAADDGRSRGQGQ